LTRRRAENTERIGFRVDESYRSDGESARDGDEALLLWRHIFGGERGLLHLATGTREDGKLTDVQAAHFDYPQAATRAASFAVDKAAAGREVYFCAHLLTAKRRVKENAAEARAAWFEMDGGELPNGQLRPTAVVESSPGHYQGYYRFTDPVPPGTVEDLNKRLAHAVGADPSGYDLTQLLRVPGTANHKYPERPLVRLLGVRPDEYVPRELDERLPKHHKGGEPGEDAQDSTDEPPVRLSPEAMRVWRGELPKYRDGEVDRSASLMKIARVLYNAGATGRVIVEALAERDHKLGYEKYTDHRDNGRVEYERIYAKLQARDRNGHVSGDASITEDGNRSGSAVEQGCRVPVQGRHRGGSPFFLSRLPS